MPGLGVTRSRVSSDAARIIAISSAIADLGVLTVDGAKGVATRSAK